MVVLWNFFVSSFVVGAVSMFLASTSCSGTNSSGPSRVSIQCFHLALQLLLEFDAQPPVAIYLETGKVF
jgi:hypothetical protein